MQRFSLQLASGSPNTLRARPQNGQSVFPGDADSASPATLEGPLLTNRGNREVRSSACPLLRPLSPGRSSFPIVNQAATGAWKYTNAVAFTFPEHKHCPARACSSPGRHHNKSLRSRVIAHFGWKSSSRRSNCLDRSKNLEALRPETQPHIKVSLSVPSFPHPRLWLPHHPISYSASSLPFGVEPQPQLQGAS